MSTAIDSSRRLALRLHALHGDDRAWILSRIPEEAKARLEPLLKELDDLGFSISQEMVDALDVQAGDAGHTCAGAGEYERHIEALDGAPAEWIVEQLRGEPPAVLDCLLSVHAWSWSQGVKPSVIPAEPSMQHGEPRVAATPKVRQTLLREMAKRMPAQFPASAQAERPENAEAPALAAARAVERIREILRSRLPWKR